ncbi:hypothetical protein TIFTF001_019587 [Ficus carica]|uniref:Uncharacterized protein n=1 Tax=Ficus carica TaxID=3494 RepID=A0AA88DBW8_FICCA|nr:hypothetical protein TIFTF001_019587 [Ficus carica]
MKLEGARKAGLDLDENGRLIFPDHNPQNKYKLQRRTKPSFPPWVPVENLGKSWFENRAKLAEAMEKRRKAREKRQAITHDDAESCIPKTGKEPDEKVEETFEPSLTYDADSSGERPCKVGAPDEKIETFEPNK